MKQGLTIQNFNHLSGSPQHLENSLELQYPLYILYIFLGKWKKKSLAQPKFGLVSGSWAMDLSGPDEVFIGTRSQMSLIMNKICLVTPELLALKDWKLLFWPFLALYRPHFSIRLDQSCTNIYRPKISDEFNNEQNPSSICPWMMENCVLNLVSKIETWFLNQSGLKLIYLFSGYQYLKTTYNYLYSKCHLY